MQTLLADSTLTGGAGADVAAMATSELEYLDKRSDFWRQQKPIYARQKDTIKVKGKGDVTKAASTSRWVGE